MNENPNRAPENDMVRQGDILLVKIDEPPSGKPLKREARGAVLAHGEATGHAHVVKSPRARLYLDGERLLLHVDGLRDVSLSHEEHDPIQIRAGTYQVIRQQEYEPKGVRYVAD